MSKEMKAFLEKLFELCTEYGARLSYTIDDDGVHVSIGDEDISIGWPEDGVHKAIITSQ